MSRHQPCEQLMGLPEGLWSARPGLTPRLWSVRSSGSLTVTIENGCSTQSGDGDPVHGLVHILANITLSRDHRGIN